MRTEDLDRLTAKFPDCIIAAFADISTGITLVTNSGHAFPQEAMDELCGEAAVSLGAADAPPIGMQPCTQVVKADDTAIFIYLRTLSEPNDALIFMCRPQIQLSSFLDDACACLEHEV